MNARQLNRDIEPDIAPTAFVHPSLRDYLDPVSGAWGSLFAPPFQLEFADYAELSARGDVDGAPIVLPVNTESQAERLQSIRSRYAMGLIVAVTNDVTGHSTYFAIRSGANFVINIAISVERQAEVLRAQLLDHTSTMRKQPRQPVLGAVPDHGTPPRGTQGSGRASRRVAAAGAGSRAQLDEFDARLLRMLRTSLTVAEIARLNYLSERSMYRRIRNLYDTLGVVGRAELVGTDSRDTARSSLTVLRG